MKTILVFTRFSSSGFRQVMEGVRRLAESDGWNLRVIETGKSRRTPTEIVEAWRPDGCIVYCPQRGLTIPSAFHRRVPTVLVSPVVPPKERDVFWVRHDSTATGRRAATALLRLGLEHFAFVGWEIPRDWSRARCRGFCDELADIGLSCEVFRGTWRMDDPLTAQKALAARFPSAATVVLDVTRFAADGDVGAMVKSPYGGDWIYWRMLKDGKMQFLR
mgnify:CR=1 FL=1